MSKTKVNGINRKMVNKRKKKYKAYVSVGFDYIVYATDEEEAEEKAYKLFAERVGSVAELELFGEARGEVEGRDF